MGYRFLKFLIPFVPYTVDLCDHFNLIKIRAWTTKRYPCHNIYAMGGL